MQLRAFILGLALTASALPLPSAEPELCVVNKLIARCSRDSASDIDIAKRVAGNTLWQGNGPDGVPEIKRERVAPAFIDIAKRADHQEASVDIA